MEISQTLIIGSWINAKAQGFVGVSASVEGSFKGLVWDVWGLGFGGFRNFGVPYFGVLMIRILPFTVLY